MTDPHSGHLGATEACPVCKGLIEELSDMTRVRNGLLGRCDDLRQEIAHRDETIRTLIGLAESATQQLTHLRNLVEYHMRREPVIDREIYCFRNVQGFAQSYKTLFDLPREGKR